MTSERHLHYLWACGYALRYPLRDRHGEIIEVLDRGVANHQDGPDFLNAKIRYRGIEFIGAIEIHLFSSLWKSHGHDNHPAYNGVILHIVWIDDASPESLEKRGVPCVELSQTLNKLSPEKLDTHYSFNACEGLDPEHKQGLDPKYLEHLLVMRVEAKIQQLEIALNDLQGNWNALWLSRLMYSLGLKPNAEAFLEIFNSVPFSVWRRLSPSLFSLQLLLLGRAGLLEKLGENLEEEYRFILTKFQLSERKINVFKKVLPRAAPHLRLLQVSGLFFQQDLFSRVVPDYSYLCGIELMQNKVKVAGRALLPPPISDDLAERIIINELIPLHLLYQRKQRGTYLEPSHFFNEISAEKNSVLKAWKKWGIKAKNAGESQALIHQYHKFCEKRLCHLCPVGGAFI